MGSLMDEMHWEPEMEMLHARIRELEAVVERLPETEDGVKAHPGMTVYKVFDGLPAEAFMLEDWQEVHERLSAGPDGYYSTPAAAEAAKKGGA